MKRFYVSLLVCNPSLSLDQLSSALGQQHSGGSHNKGEPHVLEKSGRPPWSETVWRLDSGVSEDAPVVDHLKGLTGLLPPSDLVRRLPANSTVLIDIAVFFDTLGASVSISRRAMEIVNTYRAGLEITSYPSDFSAEEESAGLEITSYPSDFSAEEES